MIRAEARTARKTRWCSRCEKLIKVGDRYLWSVASPNHDDLGNTRWWSLPECEECARRCQRWPDQLAEDLTAAG